MNDATKPASNDFKRARFTIPFSAKTRSAQVLDSKSPANFVGFPANLRKSKVSSHKTPPVFSPDGDDDDDVSNREKPSVPSRDDDDVTPAKTLSFERLTDNNTSETPDVDDDFLHIDKKLKRAKRE